MNKKHKRIKLHTVLFLILIILFGIVVFFVVGNDTPFDHKDDANSFWDTKILGDSNDLVSFSVEGGQEVSGVLNVTGSVSGKYFSEGNILVNILDSNKKILKRGNGNAKGEWMTNEPVGFDAVLDFTKLSKGKAYIEIHNDNASGLPENNKSILIPIIIK